MSLLLLLRSTSTLYSGTGTVAGAGTIAGTGTFQQATIATSAVYVDVLYLQTNLTGPIQNIMDDPLTPDGLFMAGAPGLAPDLRVGFGLPQGTLVNGAGQQKFRVRLRKSA